jgi:hypothetical protein
VPTSRRAEPRFPARFDDTPWEEDLANTTPTGRAVAIAARIEYERDGVPRSHLKPCEQEGRDRTSLPQCVKTYLPRPNGRFGIVFEAVHVDGKLRLEYVAFGVRHHPRDSRAQTVYDIAHGRLRKLTAKDADPPATEKG